MAEDADGGVIDLAEDAAHAATPDLGDTDVVRTVAKSLGWLDKDQYGNEGQPWVDAADFLIENGKKTKGLRKQMDEMRDAVKRSAKAAERIIEDQRKKAIADARKAVREAAASGDEDAAEEAATALAKAVETPAEDTKSIVADFAKRNATWFEVDDDATAMAVAVCGREAAKGASHEEQLRKAEAAVRRAFPDLFEDKPAKKDPPAVEGGSRGNQGAPRAKGWADIPAAARQAAEKAFIKGGRLTKEEYATSYWEEN